MFYTPTNSTRQVNSGKRSNKNPPLDRLPIIHPALISKAARVQRIRARHHVYLNILTLFVLIDFHLQCKRVSEELSELPLQDGYVYGMIHGRMGLAVPATYYFENSRRSLWRLEILLEYHQSYLSKDAATIIKQTIEQHRAKLMDMWTAREGLAALEAR
jgi:hypothetical protein